ncbi:MAG: DUF72 domain-containing protein [Thermoplasmata archaeon]|nr:DUF72 domain-containing protein [Thermoplasmata archaeon]
MGKILIGTCGWDYPEWVGPFYPKRGVSDRLRYYAQQFPIVEVDSTFYRLPPASHALSWSKRTPAGFRFAVKFPQSITHDRRLVESGRELREFLEVLAPLRESGKFAAALLQLPPSLTFDARSVRRFYETLPPGLPVAVEFREKSWLDPESLSLLREFRLAHVVVDEPLLPVRLEVTAPFSYLRFHGHGAPVWYDYTYSPAELTSWVPKVRELAERSEAAYVFFNNHFRGDAASNGTTLTQLLNLPPPAWRSTLMP